jgi:hypothetical protein
VLGEVVNAVGGRAARRVLGGLNSVIEAAVSRRF